MQLHEGDMFSYVTFGHGVHCVTTTNNIVKANGELVMGRGHALSTAERYPSIAREFGKRVSELHNKDYGILVSKQHPVVAFQTKRHWRDRSTLDLIQLSTQKLVNLAGFSNDEYHLAFPGIGNGGLKVQDVLPIIKALPDRVHVWCYETLPGQTRYNRLM